MTGWMLMGLPFAFLAFVWAGLRWDATVPVVVGVLLTGSFTLGLLVVLGVVVIQ